MKPKDWGLEITFRNSLAQGKKPVTHKALNPKFSPLRAGGMFEDPVGRGGAEGTTSSPVSISARTGVCVQSLWHLVGVKQE